MFTLQVFVGLVVLVASSSCQKVPGLPFVEIFKTSPRGESGESFEAPEVNRRYDVMIDYDFYPFGASSEEYKDGDEDPREINGGIVTSSIEELTGQATGDEGLEGELVNVDYLEDDKSVDIQLEDGKEEIIALDNVDEIVIPFDESKELGVSFEDGTEIIIPSGDINAVDTVTSIHTNSPNREGQIQPTTTLGSSPDPDESVVYVQMVSLPPPTIDDLEIKESIQVSSNDRVGNLQSSVEEMKTVAYQPDFLSNERQNTFASNYRGRSYSMNEYPLSGARDSLPYLSGGYASPIYSYGQGYYYGTGGYAPQSVTRVGYIDPYAPMLYAVDPYEYIPYTAMGSGAYLPYNRQPYTEDGYKSDINIHEIKNTETPAIYDDKISIESAVTDERGVDINTSTTVYKEEFDGQLRSSASQQKNVLIAVNRIPNDRKFDRAPKDHIDIPRETPRRNSVSQNKKNISPSRVQQNLQQEMKGVPPGVDKRDRDAVRYYTGLQMEIERSSLLFDAIKDVRSREGKSMKTMNKAPATTTTHKPIPEMSEVKRMFGTHPLYKHLPKSSDTDQFQLKEEYVDEDDEYDNLYLPVRAKSQELVEIHEARDHLNKLVPKFPNEEHPTAPSKSTKRLHLLPPTTYRPTEPPKYKKVFAHQPTKYEYQPERSSRSERMLDNPQVDYPLVDKYLIEHQPKYNPTTTRSYKPTSRPYKVVTPRPYKQTTPAPYKELSRPYRTESPTPYKTTPRPYKLTTPRPYRIMNLKPETTPTPYYRPPPQPYSESERQFNTKAFRPSSPDTYRPSYSGHSLHDPHISSLNNHSPKIPFKPEALRREDTIPIPPIDRPTPAPAPRPAPLKFRPTPDPVLRQDSLVHRPTRSHRYLSLNHEPNPIPAPRPTQSSRPTPIYKIYTTTPNPREVSNVKPPIFERPENSPLNKGRPVVAYRKIPHENLNYNEQENPHSNTPRIPNEPPRERPRDKRGHDMETMIENKVQFPRYGYNIDQFFSDFPPFGYFNFSPEAGL